MAVQVTRSGVALTVGIIILGLVALGGLYLVREQGEQARRDDAIKVAEERLEAESNEEVTVDGAAEEQTATDEANSNGQGAAGEDAENNAAGGSGAAGQGEASGGGAGNGAQGATDGQPATELPQTGPEALGAVVSIGALTYAGVVYIRSRRAV